MKKEQDFVLTLGEDAACWALQSKIVKRKFISLDDYELCDEVYNYINKNRIKLIR